MQWMPFVYSVPKSFTSRMRFADVNQSKFPIGETFL